MFECSQTDSGLPGLSLSRITCNMSDTLPHSMKTHTQDYMDIELPTLIGVFEWERQSLRPLVFDVHLTAPDCFRLSRAEVVAQMATWLEPCRYRLLEALAEHFAQRMLQEWPCSHVAIGIEKPGALGDLARVGIRIERGAQSLPR